MIAPPRFATWLLGAALSPSEADAVLGDLCEEFNRHIARARGRRAACWWYRSQVARSLIPIVRRSWQRATATRASAAIVSAAFASTVPASALILLRTFVLQQVPLKTTTELSALFAVTLAAVVVCGAALGMAAALRMLNGAQRS